jgi:hypothetical protein
MAFRLILRNRRPPAGLLTVRDPCNWRVGNYRCYQLAVPADSGSFAIIHTSHYKLLRSEVLTVVKISVLFLWVVTPCTGGGKSYLYFQGSLFTYCTAKPAARYITLCLPILPTFVSTRAVREMNFVDT